MSWINGFFFPKESLNLPEYTHTHTHAHIVADSARRITLSSLHPRTCIHTHTHTYKCTSVGLDILMSFHTLTHLARQVFVSYLKAKYEDIYQL